LRGSVDKARLYALKLLSYRGRSAKELEERLKRKGFPKTVISSTIRYLKRTGLVNDRALAEALKREATSKKLLSHYAARRFLITRGIPKEIVDSLFIPDDREDIETAKRLIERKLKTMKNCPTEKIKKRLHSLLLRRGYSFETIKAVLLEKTLMED